jgi:MerR HTH family regulatory protein
MGDVTPLLARPGELLAGYSTREQLARKVGRTVHTIRKWEKQGLKVIRRGNLRLYEDEQARRFLTGEVSGGEPRRPGRPAKR